MKKQNTSKKQNKNRVQKGSGRSKTYETARFLLINNKSSFLNLITAKYKYTHTTTQLDLNVFNKQRKPSVNTTIKPFMHFCTAF